MSTLFSLRGDVDRIPPIPGLTYHLDYITPQEETKLAEQIDSQPWDTTWKRRRQLYGASYGDKREIVLPIPSWAHSLIDRMHAEGISPWLFDQMLVNEYLPGQGISMHRDYEPFDRIVVSLSMLSPCVMDFQSAETGQKESMLLEPRSLLVLRDDARYQWQHGIAPRKRDRWQGNIIHRHRRLSVTFRRMKPKASER